MKQVLVKIGVDMSTTLSAENAGQEAIVYDAITKMIAGISHFIFIKKDGTKRESFGTLNPRIIENIGGPRASSDSRANTLAENSAQNYFDLEAGDWRAFVKENLIIVF